MRKVIFRKWRLPPFWKVQREWQRFNKRYGLMPLYEKMGLTTLFHDVYLRRKVILDTGQIAFGDRVAIYLIFPSDGVQASHVAALKHISASGYAPFVVSNCPLTAEDRSKFLPHTWKLMQRPNYGYDFGGYREAVLTLYRTNQAPEYLAFLNDSAWFPTNSDGSWLTKAESLPADFVGAVANYGTVPPKDSTKDALLNFQWSYDETAQKLHYCSFALLVKPNITKRRSFQKFWQRFRLSNDKFRTIAYGEIGLSRFLIKGGHSHAATFSGHTLGDTIDAMSPKALRKLLSELIIPDLRGFHECHELLLDSDNALSPETWVKQAKSFLYSTIAWHGPAFTIPSLKADTSDFPFLKKSLVTFHEDGSKIALNIAKELDANVSYGLAAEAENHFNPAKSVQKAL